MSALAALGHAVSPGEQAQVTQAGRSRHHRVQVQERGQIPARGDFSPLAALDKPADGGF